MLETINKLWNEYGFEIVVGLSFLIIFILLIVNYFIGSKGSYSSPRIFKSNESPRERYVPEDGFTSKLELQSKVILENVFKKPFERIRPDFLRNDVTGQNLEIDLYNEELRLAVEVQGEQHYKFTPFFQKNKEAFMNQKYRDEMKKEKCRQNGVILIEVPYKVGEKGLREYLLDQLRLKKFLV